MVVGREVQSSIFIWSDHINRYIGIGSKGVITGITPDKKVLVKFNTYNFEMTIDPEYLDFVNGNGKSHASNK